MAVLAQTSPASLDSEQTEIRGSMKRQESMRDDLPYLPIEIQLQILKAHMVSSRVIPLFDRSFVGTDLPTQSKTDSWKTRVPKALLVCRLFCEEGWKYFWQQNQFLVSPGNTPGPLRYHIQWSKTAFRNLRHLQIRRVVSENHESWLQAALYVCEAADNFANLDTLEVDFVIRVSRFEHAGAYRVKANGPMMHAHRYYEYFRHSLLRGSTTIGRNVKKITVTGLPSGILGCLMVRLMATLLRKQGTIVFGTGLRGYKYTVCYDDDDHEFRTGRGRPVLKTLQAGEVDEWIDKEVVAAPRVPSWWSWFATSDEREEDASYLEWRQLVRMAEEMAA
ncbi:hypothetical protein G7Y79_00069g096370 [Physcia stellaris]|nr:hypothetical protein G7Y79_00069g096370 [Physcia stellaris]